MKFKKFIPSLFVFALMLFIYACQQPEKKTEEAASKDFPFTTQSDEALKYFNEGLLARDLGDRQRALPLFEKAIEKDPDFAMAYAWKAFSARSGKEFTENVKIANEKNNNLTEAEQLLVELANAFMTNDLDKRFSVAKSMVEKYPDVARSHVTLGQAYESMNDNANARKCFEKAIELNPEWIVGYSLLGNSYVFDEPKDLAKAEANMIKGIELLPNEARAHIALGDVYRAQQNLEKALVSYQKAAELAPNDPVAYSKAGHVNTYLGNFDEARKDFEKSGTVSEFPAAALNFTAFTYLYAGDHAKGITWLKNQVASLDDSGMSKDRILGSKENILNNCMWMAYHMNDVKELKALVDQIEPIDYENAKSRGTKEAMMFYNAYKNFREGLIAVLEGNNALANEKAEAHKNDLADINNSNKLEDYHFLIGEISMKEGKYADAIAHFEQSDLDDIYSKYKLAMANKSEGNTEIANKMLKEISEYNFNEIGYALVRKEVQDMLATAS